MVAKVMKFWREASTVMLITRSTSNPKIPPVPFKSRTSMFDYNVLMLKRSEKSGFMPNAYVFPGGVIAEADYSVKWGEIYEAAGYDHPDINLPKIKAADAQRSPMFTMERDWPISNRVTFRISAIRETFEETGILLYKKWKSRTEKVNKTILNEWRPLVYNSDVNFLEMCKELQVVPDVWALQPWSNWLTPANMVDGYGKRRYDTAFYIAMHSKPIPSVHDEHEIIKSEWCEPKELLERYEDRQIWLAPPQIYELYRLSNFSSFDSLDQFVHNRSDKGCERWLPVRMKCKDDVFISTMPGDDLYPDEPDVEGQHGIPEVNQTALEARQASRHLNRFEITDGFCRLFCNVHAKFDVPSPKLKE